LLDALSTADAGHHDFDLAELLSNPQRFLKRDGVERITANFTPSRSMAEPAD